MSKLTPFGLLVRTLRLRKGINLNEMAEKIQVTSSFISGIEVGRRPIPKNYVEKVFAALNATPQEIEELIEAADQSRKTIDIENLQSNENKALVGALARKADKLTPQQRETIVEIIASLSSMQNAHPFNRQRGCIVAPQNYEAIWNISEKIYNFSPKLSNGWLNIQYMLENIHIDYPDWELDVVEPEWLKNEEGRTDFTSKTIIIRQDVWNDLNRNDKRARFTACHEFGHFILHRNQTIGMSRAENFPIYQDAEWQADVFAGSLLIPKSKLNEQDSFCGEKTILNIGNIFGASSMATLATLKMYNKKNKIPSYKNFFERIK